MWTRSLLLVTAGIASADDPARVRITDDTAQTALERPMKMAGHVPVDEAVEYPNHRSTGPGALAGNGTGSPWWPLTPGTCIDYDVYAVTVSWDNATNSLGITSRGAKQAPQRICAYTRDCPSCGYHGMPMEQYEQPAGTARGYLTEGVSVDAQGVASIGESGNNFATYTDAFLGKLPVGAGSPLPGQYVNSVTRVLPQSVCAGSTAACSTGGTYPPDYWTLHVISMGKWGPWADTTRTGLLESVYGRYNYVFARGKGMVNFWYYGVNTDPNYNTCTADCQGIEYYATGYPTDQSPEIGQPPFWAAYP
jgi:hypothetical protein